MRRGYRHTLCSPPARHFLHIQFLVVCLNYTMNRSQRSNSSRSSSRVASSSRGNASSELNLTVLGSSCPRGERPRKKQLQPPDSPARPLLLPIDRLIQYRSEMDKLEEGCVISGGRSNSVASSTHPELAIDLSELSDSYSGTQRSTDSSYDESEWSGSWLPKKHPKNKQKSDSSSGFSALPRTYENICQKSYRTTESVCSRCSTQIRERGSDLIQVYVQTVNNADLSKFFRPCPLCGQQSCNCPPSPTTPKCNTCAEKQCECVSDLNNSCSECKLRYCLCLPKNGYFESVHNTTRRSDLYPEPPAMLQRNLADQTADSGNSTLQLDDSCREVAPRTETGILSKQHVSLSVMQLATAAQCARILADSLENVLQLAREELTPEISSRSDTRMESVFPHDTLLSAIEALNKTSNISDAVADSMPNA